MKFLQFLRQCIHFSQLKKIVFQTSGEQLQSNIWKMGSHQSKKNIWRFLRIADWLKNKVAENSFLTLKMKPYGLIRLENILSEFFKNRKVGFYGAKNDENYPFFQQNV